MELIELLNKLIEKGWKPRGLKHKIFSVQRTPDNMIYFDGGFGLERCYDFRQLTSKESGLWQFVCENNLIKTKGKKIKISTEDFDGYKGFFILYGYEYWLAMSALCNEENLDKFLLENIKI